MSVLIPRNRMLGVRLSGDEYAALEKFCMESGARSISDLARNAICSFLNRADQQTALLASVSENSAQVKELEQRLEMIAGELASLKAGMPIPIPGNSDVGDGEAECYGVRDPGPARSTEEMKAQDVAVGFSCECLSEDN